MSWLRSTVAGGLLVMGATWSGLAYAGCDLTNTAVNAPDVSACGQIVDEQNVPIANAPVVLKDSTSENEITVFTDEHGVFRAYNLEGGAYTVELPLELSKMNSESSQSEALLLPGAGGDAKTSVLLIEKKSFLQNILGLEKEPVDFGTVQSLR